MGELQFEKCVRNLQHQNVWMVVLVADKDSLAGSTHAMFVIVLFQPLQACEHGGVLFRLVLFRAEGVVAEREEADGRRLVCVECFGEDGPVRFTSLSETLAEGKKGRL